MKNENIEVRLTDVEVYKQASRLLNRMEPTLADAKGCRYNMITFSKGGCTTFALALQFKHSTSYNFYGIVQIEELTAEEVKENELPLNTRHWNVEIDFHSHHPMEPYPDLFKRVVVMSESESTSEDIIVWIEKSIGAVNNMPYIDFIGIHEDIQKNNIDK